MSGPRADDEPTIPTDVHHWLSKLEDDIAGVRSGLADLTKDVNDLRVMQAKASQPNIGVIIALMGLIATVGVQTAYGVYWGGGINSSMAYVVKQVENTTSVLGEHISTAGPFRSGMEGVVKLTSDIDGRMRLCSERLAVVTQRVDAIEARNKIADQNWEVLKRKGILLERTR